MNFLKMKAKQRDCLAIAKGMRISVKAFKVKVSAKICQ